MYTYILQSTGTDQLRGPDLMGRSEWQRHAHAWCSHRSSYL